MGRHHDLETIGQNRWLERRRRSLALYGGLGVGDLDGDALRQLEADGNAFEDGQIYNGENGKTYNANIGLQPDGTLRLRGYVGTPMFGETQIWTRVQ